MTMDETRSAKEVVCPARYYFDMDGTLAKYDRAVYCGNPPLFEDPNNHYFLQCKPDIVMLKVFSQYVRRAMSGDGTEVAILSSMMPGSVGRVHWHDKQLWLRRHLSQQVAAHTLLFPVVGESKAIAAERLKGAPLTKQDILIDDYNPNLEEWRTAGGRAIKYINGVNSHGSFDGEYIEAGQGGEGKVVGIIDDLDVRNFI